MPTITAKSELLKQVWNRAWGSAMLYGSLATAVRVGANILLLPLVLKVLAPPELAVWYVFLALGGMANLADFGFGSAIGRIYSFLWAGADDFDTEGLREPSENRDPNLPRIRQFHSAVRTVYTRIGLGAMVFLALVGSLSVLKPIGIMTNPVAGWAAWAAFILSITFSLGTNHWVIACGGINRVRDLQATHLAGGLSYVASAAALLILGWGLFAMVVATAIRAVVTRHMCRRAYLSVVRESGDGVEGDVRSVLKRVWPNARKLGITSLGGYLVLQANVLVCSHFFGSEVTASYGLTNQVANFMMSFSALWLMVKWPQITILRTQGRLEEMAVLFARRLTMVMLSLALMSVVLVLCGNALLEWKGTQTRFLPTVFLIVFLANMFQQQFYSQFGILTFTENVVPFFKLSIFVGIATVTLSIFLSIWFGLWGLVLAPLIVTGTSSTWYVTMRGFRGQPLNVRRFARAAVLGHA